MQEILPPAFSKEYLETNISFLFFQYRLAGPCHTSNHWAAKGYYCCGQFHESRLAGKERPKMLEDSRASYENMLSMPPVFYRARSIAWLRSST